MSLETVVCPVCGEGEGVEVLRSWYRVVRCLGCDMVWANPRPDEASRAGMYGADYYVFDPVLDRAHTEAAARDVERMLAWREDHPGRLLDVGCATGHFLAAAREAGWTVTGVEVSPEAAARARTRARCTVHACELEAAHLPPASFDAVTLLDVLEHVARPVDLLALAGSLLAPGGRLVVECPNFGSLFRRLTGRRWVGFNPYHLHFFTPATLAQAARRAGLRPVSAVTTPPALFSAEGRVRLQGREPWSEGSGSGGAGERRDESLEPGPVSPRVPGTRRLLKRVVAGALNAAVDAAGRSLGWGRQVVLTAERTGS